MRKQTKGRVRNGVKQQLVPVYDKPKGTREVNMKLDPNHPDQYRGVNETKIHNNLLTDQGEIRKVIGYRSIYHKNFGKQY